MKRMMVCSLGFFCLAWALAAQEGLSADAIVRSSRDRIQADTTYTESVMVLTKKNGSTSERSLKQYTKEGSGGKRMVIEFLRPPSVEGVRFLTTETPGGADNRWIFLPKEGDKVRRIAASAGAQSFQGTDFSNDDISSSSRSADLDTHTLLREEALNGAACYVIESVPKDRNYQYSKMVQWIDKSGRVTLKAELYDRRSRLVKVLEVGDLRDVQGRLTAMTTRMTTLAAGTSTVINISLIKYNDPIPDSTFTTEFLETGRAR
jgi:outer membrane lipoprotein-sorting protein